jgi:hypothetical protein
MSQRLRDELPLVAILRQAQVRVPSVCCTIELTGSDRRKAEMVMRIREQRVETGRACERFRRGAHTTLCLQRAPGQQRELGALRIRGLQLAGELLRFLEPADLDQLFDIRDGAVRFRL